MLNRVFESENYVSFLIDALDAMDSPRGKRAELARFLGCQTSFISQVLTGRAHLGREQAIKVSEFLKLKFDETRFFMLLIDRDRAGSASLREFYQQQIESILNNREEVKDRIGVTGQVPEEAHYTYYGSWIYSAVHILTALPDTRTVPAIANYLNVPVEKVTQVVEWLVNHGLIERKDNLLSIGKTRVHIGSNSPFVARHHTNWRLKSLEYFDQARSEDLHYSSICGISREATIELKTMLMKFLSDSERVIVDAPEERATVLLLDLFKL